MIWLLLSACTGPASPAQSNLAEYERCQDTAECASGLQCLGARLEPVGDESWESGECRRDEAQHRETVDTLHATLSKALAAAAAASPETPKSCGELSAEGNHYVVETSWAQATAAGADSAPHYISAGVPSEFNGRLKPSEQMSVSDLVGCGRQTQWLLAKRYLAVSVEDELLFPVIDFQSKTYVPGHVRARVYLYDTQTDTLLCGGVPFEGAAERATTSSPAEDLQASAKDSLKAALKGMAPGLRFYL